MTECMEHVYEAKAGSSGQRRHTKRRNTIAMIKKLKDIHKLHRESVKRYRDSRKNYPEDAVTTVEESPNQLQAITECITEEQDTESSTSDAIKKPNLNNLWENALDVARNEGYQRGKRRMSEVAIQITDQVSTMSKYYYRLNCTCT